jgi:hypothetical protein
MAGFSAEKAREIYSIPDDFEPLTAIAVGHPGSPDELPEDFREMETLERERIPLKDILFEGKWGSSPLSEE